MPVLESSPAPALESAPKLAVSLGPDGAGAGDVPERHDVIAATATNPTTHHRSITP